MIESLLVLSRIQDKSAAVISIRAIGALARSTWDLLKPWAGEAMEAWGSLAFVVHSYLSRNKGRRGEEGRLYRFDEEDE